MHNRQIAAMFSVLSQFVFGPISFQCNIFLQKLPFKEEPQCSKYDNRYTSCSYLANLSVAVAVIWDDMQFMKKAFCL